jgi:outer membrane protein insertion porin family
MFYAGSEYAFPLIGENLRGVVFVDSGTVEESCSFTNYRVSIGAGLRIKIPFMGPVPMALDFGIPVMKAEEDDTQLLSFSVGWSF